MKNKINYEKKTIDKMVRLYCRLNHHETELCDDCRELRDYAIHRLEKCKFGEEKPACAKCPVHCYKPEMREKIKRVMRFSGPRMLLYHPLDAFRHIFGR